MGSKHAERPVLTGRILSDVGYMMILVSPTGVWTLFIVTEDGRACQTGHGDTLTLLPLGEPT
jgi:hypothetical protein